MSAQLVFVMKDGRRIIGINYRADPAQKVFHPMDSGAWNGGTYHVETANGWVNIAVSDLSTLVSPNPQVLQPSTGSGSGGGTTK